MPSQSSNPLPLVGVTMGDPLGIGAEVVVKSLGDESLRARGRFVVFGTASAMAAATKQAAIPAFWRSVRVGESAGVTGGIRAGEVVLIDYGGVERWKEDEGSAAEATAAGGELSFRFVEDSIRAADPRVKRTMQEETLAAVVTGPINKHAWMLAGHREFPGHTELFTSRLDAGKTRMMFVAPGLRTILVTTHVGLAEVPRLLSVERVADTIRLGHEACVRLGLARPRIAVCGLNPHASEGGLFGDEEARHIAPAIEAARSEGIDASGPWPGDTIFTAAIKGKYDLVVALYHDQGLIPVKLLAFDSAVNATVGLPIVRTSPDHGTAYDIAGKNLADPGSMRAAIELAIRWASDSAVKP